MAVIQSSRRNTGSSSKSIRKRRKPFLRIFSKRAVVVRWILFGLLSIYLFIQFFFLFIASPDNNNLYHSSVTETTAISDLYKQLYEFRRKMKKNSSLNKKKEQQQQQKLQVQKILLRTMGRKTLPLKAFVEEGEPLKLDQKPLPIRDHIKLIEYTYPNVNGCYELQNSLPVDHPKNHDSIISPIVGNFIKPIYPIRDEYAMKYCPVDADPYLPWLHDVFINVADKNYVDFVAHNKRRCRTSPNFRFTDLTNLEPQIALMQSVPIKRIPPIIKNDDNNTTTTTTTYRYRLSSIEEADDDGKETRFICQFHTLRPKKSITTANSNNNDDDEVEKIIVGETLSIFPYNYEHANYRKGPPNPNPLPMLTRPVDEQDKKGVHNEQIWNSILHFRCPVPDRITEYFNYDDDDDDDEIIPTFYVDLVPIRTPPRETREGYCPQLIKESTFDPMKEWGNNHILPQVEDSGRWANIPICRPKMFSSSPSSSSGKINKENTKTQRNAYKTEQQQQQQIKTTNDNIKKDYLVGCLWASAAFSTRGTEDLDKSTLRRLLEWLTYHLYIAKFDHIYIYDNSEAHNQNNVSLKPIIDMFPSNRVTRIPWKHRICNNNRPMHPNVGERSSQYAAEASCRLRYGPTTTWLMSFDADEYLIPQANWTDIKSWLVESVNNGKISPNTHILSFFQTRALPNIDYMKPHRGNEPECRNNNNNNNNNNNDDDDNNNCLAKRQGTTFLEAYDCEKTPLPKPDYGWRAKKQIYRPEFVLNHFVHYTVATRRLLEAPEERSSKFVVGRPYERRVDEITEAFMLHTKTTPPTSTKGWKKRCKNPDNPEDCPVGIPFPPTGSRNSNNNTVGGEYNPNGFAYNCYPHDRIQNSLKQKLEKLLQPLQKIMHSSIQ